MADTSVVTSWKDKVATGILGLDYLLRGGLPAHRIHLIEGHPGSGKTTFGLQFLLEGVRNGESCMYITLSETADELRANAASHGWDLSGIHIQELQPAENLRPEEQYTLFHPAEIELGDLSKNVFEAVETFKPARAVLDSVSDMRLLARDSLRYRRQILGLKQFFVGRGCTVLLLNENGTDDTDPHIQSLSHGVIRLEQTIHDFGLVRRRLQISKLRGVSYVGGFHDFKMQTGGIRVFPRLENRRQSRPLPKETLKSGLPQIDTLLDTGVPMGTCTLILGPSGVGKSTLGGQYLSAAARKGIHCAAFLFDEQRMTFIERGDVLGMQMSKYVKNDILKIAKVEPGLMSPGEFSHSVRKAVEDDKVRVVLIDSLTGYLTAIPEPDAAVVRLHELTSYLASSGVATFLTVAQQGMLGQNMVSPIDVSYIADTMFMMRFFEARGEVRKALSVLKKRTGMHETTIREIGVRKNALWVGEPLVHFRGVLSGVPELQGPGRRLKGQDQEARVTSPLRQGRLDDRILIFAPVGKDAPLTLEVLQRTDLKGTVCNTAHNLCVEIARGASVIMLTEEALEDAGIGELMECLRTQPAWSDIPILLFADAERSEIYLRTLRLLEGLRNVVLLERPIRLGAALSLIRSAMRGRNRQYELRNLLKALADSREEAEAANRLKDEFLATLSHELRTPLNAILGWTTMLRDGNVQQIHVMRALDTIHRNATAQVQIVNDLLDVSRIVRGNVQLAPKIMPVGPMVMFAVESITPTAEAKGVTIGASLGDTPVLVWADPDRLQQVLWNLMVNAVKFTPAGGRVDVRMDATPAEVTISVADTGAGIPSNFLPHVFERFRQADGSSTRPHGGLGLGLSIVRHLVELHGGRMQAESAGEGKGSTFTVHLPVRHPDERAATAVAAGGRRRRLPDLEGTHILVVDDHEDARQLLRAMLSDTGARISEAESAAQAFKIMIEDRPDIILADVAMPEQDGYTMMRAIRSLPQGPRIGAIAVSAYARREDGEMALNSGFDGHIGKPVQPQRLFEALERVSAQRLEPLISESAEPDSRVH